MPAFPLAGARARQVVENLFALYRRTNYCVELYTIMVAGIGNKLVSH